MTTKSSPSLIMITCALSASLLLLVGSPKQAIVVFEVKVEQNVSTLRSPFGVAFPVMCTPFTSQWVSSWVVVQLKHCCAPLLIITSLGEIVVSKGKMDSYNINCIVCGNNGHDVICICTRHKQCDNYILFVTVGIHWVVLQPNEVPLGILTSIHWATVKSG